MAKRITKIVLTGGPAAGKTTLVSRVLKEFKQEDGWRVITIPETATELISGFGIKPFDNCMSMLQFQDFVVGDQIHKEKLALDAAQLMPVTVYCFMVSSYLLTVLIIYPHRVYVNPNFIYNL